jgi:hypothetical protein
MTKCFNHYVSQVYLQGEGNSPNEARSIVEDFFFQSRSHYVALKLEILLLHPPKC